MDMRYFAFIFLWLFLSVLRINAQNKVIVITLDGAINPAATDYIQYGIQQAVKTNAEIWLLNTDCR